MLLPLIALGGGLLLLTKLGSKPSLVTDNDRSLPWSPPITVKPTVELNNTEVPTLPINLYVWNDGNKKFALAQSTTDKTSWVAWAVVGNSTDPSKPGVQKIMVAQGPGALTARILQNV